MRNETGSNALLTKVELTTFVVSCLLVIAGCNSSKPNDRTGITEPPQASSPSKPDSQKQQQEAEQQFRPDIEAQRQQNEAQAKGTLDQDAIAAVGLTGEAIKLITENKKDDALASIERATGKINILIARNPASALIPVSVEVVVIDTAPVDSKVIDQIVQRATDATKHRELPLARILLASLVSELRIRTTSLPLTTYPGALQQAAQLLDQGKNQDAGKVLLTALNTLVMVDHVIPLPLILAQAAIDAANSQRQNKDIALTLLQTARNEANRSRLLGYLSSDSEYKGLDDEISSLESAINGKGDTSSMFSHLRDRISAFLKRQKEHEQR
ncbi:MAG TPA: YfdX family protein [Edaphobacter sp.]|nr:YfdX family protein [Edaphobacter sp.]